MRIKPSITACAVVWLLFIAGCANLPQAREARLSAYLKQHPDLSSDIQELVRQGVVRTGMPKEHVELSWGGPSKTLSPVVLNSKTGELWEYGGVWGASNSLLFFVNGVLDDIVYDASSIVAAYEQNAVAADSNYKNHRLLISGQVARIDTELFGSPYVVIGADAYGLGGIQCVFPKSRASQVVPLQQYQSVILQGRCKGKVLLNVLLDDCEVVMAGK